MMFESVLPSPLGRFCEVNAGVLGLTYLSFATHQLTAVWDIVYADGRREVTPTEQLVHGFLASVALMATVLLTVLHWDQAQTPLGPGGRPDWQLKPKRRPLTSAYRVAILAAITGLVRLPYGEELALPPRERRLSATECPG